MAKRANGEGTIRKRTTKKGSVYWEGRYYDPIIKKQCSIYGNTKEEVRKQLTQKTVEKDNGKFVSRNDITLDMWFESYIKLYKEGVIRPQSVRSIRSRYTHSIKPYLGDKQIQDITDMDVKNMLNEESKIHVTSTVLHIKADITSMLEKAAEKKLLLTNPAKNIPIVEGQKETRSKRELTDEEIYWFMLGVQEKCPKDMLVFQLLLTTGARIGEIAGLKWRDFNEDFSYVTINRTVIRVQNEDEWIVTTNQPKTKASVRTLPIVPELRPEIQSWKSRLQLIAKQFDTTLTDDDFVFYNRKKDRVYDEGHFKSEIEIILGYLKNEYNIDIPHFSPHHFRHTFTTKAIRNNMSMEILKNLLGHSDYRTISKVYAHTSQKDKMDAVLNMFAANPNIKLG